MGRNGSPDLAPHRLFVFQAYKQFTEKPSELIFYVIDTHFEKPKEADNENKELDNSLLELERVNAGARRAREENVLTNVHGVNVTYPTATLVLLIAAGCLLGLLVILSVQCVSKYGLAFPHFEAS